MTNCFECESRTPNGECYIGTIERCPKLRDYLFIDNEEGGEFFVECETLNEAWQIVHRELGKDCDVDYTGEVYTPAEADVLGYDTF